MTVLSSQWKEGCVTHTVLWLLQSRHLFAEAQNKLHRAHYSQHLLCDSLASTLPGAALPPLPPYHPAFTAAAATSHLTWLTMFAPMLMPAMYSPSLATRGGGPDSQPSLKPGPSSLASVSTRTTRPSTSRLRKPAAA